MNAKYFKGKMIKRCILFAIRDNIYTDPIPVVRDQVQPELHKSENSHWYHVLIGSRLSTPTTNLEAN